MLIYLVTISGASWRKQAIALKTPAARSMSAITIFQQSSLWAAIVGLPVKLV
jgi:hypothetical protein